MQNPVNTFSDRVRFLISIPLIFVLMILIAPAYCQQKGAGTIQSAVLSPQSSEGDTYALVVGISDYQDEGIPDLQYADRDAMAFADFLRSPSGGELNEDHLKLLLNEEATMAQVAIALDWLLEVVNKDDKVIIYFSGHGDVEKANAFQPGYLLCWDALSRVYMAGGALGLTTFRGVISTLSLVNEAKVIVVTDACRSGKLSGNAVGGSRLTNTDLAQSYANEVKILSCQPEEFSIEGEQWGNGRGAFSYHLVNGLYGMADKNGDGQVNIMEVRGYLEDNVSQEVAPFFQLPITVGNGRETISRVVPEILEKVMDEESYQLDMFGALATRGFAEELLAEADSSVRLMYHAFERALDEKRFLSPEDDCAEIYYHDLMHEESLSPLHSAMTRNYAAALQDDAQQVLRELLKTGLSRVVTEDKKTYDLYRDYPSHLEKAIELLGPDHYMHDALQARKWFFIGEVEKKKLAARRAYQQALRWQPEMAHAYVMNIWTYKAEDLDSALYCASKAIDLVPSWVKPYVKMAWFYNARIKDYQKAEEWYDTAERIDSNSVYVASRKARFYAVQKRYEEAEKYFLKAIEGKTSDICWPCLHTGLGLMYSDLGRYEEALEQHLLAMNSGNDPDYCFPCSYVNQGVVYDLMGRADKAIEMYKLAIGVDSNLAVAYNNLAVMMTAGGKFELSEKHHAKAIELAPKRVLFYVKFSDTYKKQGKLDDAEYMLLKSEGIAPENVGTLLNLASLYTRQGRIPEAEEYYWRAHELKPQNLEVLVELGQLYIRDERPQEARDLFMESWKRFPENLDILSELAGIYYRTKQFSDMKEILLLLTSLDSANANYLINLGVAYLELGELDSAKEVFNQMRDKHDASTNILVYLNLSAIAVRSGDSKKAEEYLLQAHDIDTTAQRPITFLANFYRDNGQPEEAITYYKKLYKANENVGFAAGQMSRLYRQLGRHQENVDLLAHYITKYPKSHQAYNDLGLAYQRLGLLEEAMESYRKAIDLKPDYASPYINLGRIYRSQGRFEETEDMYRKAVEADPDNAQSLNNLGDMYFIMGEYDEAEGIMKRAIAADSGVWICNLTMGQVQQAKGKWEASIPYLTTSIRLNPTFPANHALLAIAYNHLNIESEKAIESILKAEELVGDNYEAMLYIAQYFALSGFEAKAWNYLSKTIELSGGEPFIRVILEREPDFERMRGDPRWGEIVRSEE